MKTFIQKIFVLSLCLAFSALTISLSLPRVPQGFAADSAVQEKDLGTSSSPTNATDAGVQATQEKGGIYKVGRGFKTAGRGMKKGFVKTGHGFKWLGGKIKRFFTGEKENKETAENTVTQDSKNSKLDHIGDDAQQAPTPSDAHN